MQQQDSKTSSSQQALSLGAADQRSSFYVMASVVAPEYKADKRAPVDMICVIDRSGSMSGDRITMAKSTVEFVVANLRHDDRLGIVTYDGCVSNHFPLRVMDETGKDAAISAIRSIRVGGSSPKPSLGN
jgi:secreted protein with Ig-like and vWFA domain